MLYNDFQISCYDFQSSCFGVDIEEYSYVIEIDSITDSYAAMPDLPNLACCGLISSSFLKAVLAELRNNLLFSAK